VAVGGGGLLPLPVGAVGLDVEGDLRPEGRLSLVQVGGEAGRAYVFDVEEQGRPARAFVLRHGGAVVAYLNRCAHVPAEMDWQEGQFLDADRRFILCSIHGAAYEPRTGRCGPRCRRGGPTGVDRAVSLR
jgi:nitrite reductase/ring-hydroxylating ferredoxin subunit